MKFKTSKLRKLEADRYSILTDDLEHCYICGEHKDDMHEIYGAGNRRISMMNGFCVPLCRQCHMFITKDNASSLLLKQQCQRSFEVENNREDFMLLIGKNYL